MLAELLKQSIETSGLTAYEIAKQAGTSPQTIYRFLKGERDLTLGTADPICRVLHLTLAKFGDTPMRDIQGDIETRARELARKWLTEGFDALLMDRVLGPPNPKKDYDSDPRHAREGL